MWSSSAQGKIFRRLVTAAKEISLTLLASAGSLCLLAVIAGAWLDIGLIVFRAGSMAPGIEAGAIAVVREVPASALRPGDIATVQREGSALPVTHRVVTSVPDPADPDGVLLTMKGDANVSADPVRYEVHTARKLLFAVPELGYWVMRFQNPWIMGWCTLAMASIVTWTFWPKVSTATVHGGASTRACPDARRTGTA